MSAHHSPEGKRESPLSLLASAIPNSPSHDSVETRVKCISLGTFPVGSQIHTFQLFVFPNGNYFSLEQLNGLFFKEGRAAVLAHLHHTSPRPGVCRDITTKSIYLASDVAHEIGQELSYPHLAALALFAREGKLSHTTSHLTKIEGLTVLQKLEEINLILTIASYIPENKKRNSAKRPNSGEEESAKAKGKNKRLSIDTRFSEKLENNSLLLEQMKSSYKVKQQQQAIIDSRTKSAHPDNSSQSGIPRTGKKVLSREILNGIDQIMSPRSEYPNRELPRPRGFDANGHPVPHSAHPLSVNHIPSPPQHPTSPPSSQQKTQFLAMCEQLYDNNEATTKLQQQLKEQIRKSATLLYTLSSSGQMIEGLVRSHFREMQSQYGEKFGAALTDLNRRLVQLENKTFGAPTQSEAFSSSGALMSAVPKENGHHFPIPTIVERLENAAAKEKEDHNSHE